MVFFFTIQFAAESGLSAYMLSPAFGITAQLDRIVTVVSEFEITSRI
jgi:hypothetical protein